MSSGNGEPRTHLKVLHHGHHLLGIGLWHSILAVKDGDQLRRRDLLKVQLNESVLECSRQELDMGSVRHVGPQVANSVVCTYLHTVCT